MRWAGFCLLSTYKGLKHSEQLLVHFLPDGLLSTYKGLKLSLPLPRSMIQVGLLSTYKGLKQELPMAGKTEWRRVY